VHLVGFTIEIYHDARPYKRQIYQPITLPALLYRSERESEITHPLTTTDTVDLRSMSYTIPLFSWNFKNGKQNYTNYVQRF